MSKEPILKFHDVANIFPMMTATEFETIKNDIAINGLREPIYLYEGKIIDGRNRYNACLETGVKPIYRNYEGTENELIDFVISLNLHRRHLTTSQKACLAVELLPELEKRTKENLKKKMSAIRTGNNEVYAKLQKLENSSKIASSIFDVSERYIFDAKKILKESKALFNAVRDGKFTLQKAFKELHKDQDTAKLQKPENVVNIELSKNDEKKIKQYVSEMKVSEHVAREFILRHKRITQPKQTQPDTHSAYKEIKFRITQDTKEKLQTLAKQQGKSVSEILRNLLAKLK